MLDWLFDQGADINRTDNRRLDSGFSLAPGRTVLCICLITQQPAATSTCSTTSSAMEPTRPSAQLCTPHHDVQTAKRPQPWSAIY